MLFCRTLLRSLIAAGVVAFLGPSCGGSGGGETGTGGQVAGDVGQHRCRGNGGRQRQRRFGKWRHRGDGG